MNRRQIPQSFREPGGQELRRIYANEGTPNVENNYPPVRILSPKESGAMFFVKNNLAFSIFVLFFVPVVIYIFLAFFAGFSAGLNAFLFGVFKRPLPDHPQLYYDINCINRMNLEDFQNTNQVQRCRDMNNIDRLGPPRQF